MNGFVIELLTFNGRCYYSTCKGDFLPVTDIELADVFYYAHQAHMAAKVLCRSVFGKGYVVSYNVKAL